jgi:hypothetical protein
MIQRRPWPPYDSTKAVGAETPHHPPPHEGPVDASWPGERSRCSACPINGMACYVRTILQHALGALGPARRILIGRGILAHFPIKRLPFVVGAEHTGRIDTSSSASASLPVVFLPVDEPFHGLLLSLHAHLFKRQLPSFVPWSVTAESGPSRCAYSISLSLANASHFSQLSAIAAFACSRLVACPEASCGVLNPVCALSTGYDGLEFPSSVC